MIQGVRVSKNRDVRPIKASDIKIVSHEIKITMLLHVKVSFKKFYKPIGKRYSIEEWAKD